MSLLYRLKSSVVPGLMQNLTKQSLTCRHCSLYIDLSTVESVSGKLMDTQDSDLVSNENKVCNPSTPWFGKNYRPVVKENHYRGFEKSGEDEPKWLKFRRLRQRRCLILDPDVAADVILIQIVNGWNHEKSQTGAYCRTFSMKRICLASTHSHTLLPCLAPGSDKPSCPKWSPPKNWDSAMLLLL